MNAWNEWVGPLREFARYVWRNKLWWIVPTVILFLLMFVQIWTDGFSPLVIQLM